MEVLQSLYSEKNQDFRKRLFIVWNPKPLWDLANEESVRGLISV